MSAGASRLAATGLGFALCLAYLLVFPFYPLGMASLIGLGAIILTLLDRREEIVTTGITTAVVMVVAAIDPEHVWRQPILRFVDTLVGITVGVTCAGVGSVLFRSPR